MEFDTYQEAAVKTRIRPLSDPSHHLLVSLLGLAGEAGELISEYKKYLRDGESYSPLVGRIREELGDLLWYIASVADEFDLSLDDVARSNLGKIQDRWSAAPAKKSVFDEDYPIHERLPRELRVRFEAFEEHGRMRTQMRIEGRDLGDSLTDNAYEDDGYRFHDIFHWACAVLLGWSPVIRKLLSRKRKSVPETDEVEDGARAAAIEEGISALVFSYAADRGFLVGSHKVDSELLRTINGMTRHLEVATCSAGDWEKTILTTFEIWRHVNSHNGGTIVVDLLNGVLAIETATGGMPPSELPSCP